MVWPTLGSRTATEQNRTEQDWCVYLHDAADVGVDLEDAVVEERADVVVVSAAGGGKQDARALGRLEAHRDVVGVRRRVGSRSQ